MLNQAEKRQFRMDKKKEKKGMKGQKNLSRRERQIMDIIYELNEATAAQVLEHLPNPPSYSAVRALLRVLEEKGHLEHKMDGPRYVFLPTMPREEARQNALRHLLKTFFDDSTEKAVAALLDISEEKLSDRDYNRLVKLIEDARLEGR
jgi:predicted transcriptional regulator